MDFYYFFYITVLKLDVQPYHRQVDQGSGARYSV